MVQALGHCFHPDTKVQLKNGNVVLMKDLNLGDILENGSLVNGIMKLDNTGKQHKLYKFSGKGVNNESIYVTGSHYIQNDDGKFIQVKEHDDAIEQHEITNFTFEVGVNLVPWKGRKGINKTRYYYVYSEKIFREFFMKYESQIEIKNIYNEVGNWIILFKKL
jgi:hypothetical protein